MFDLQIEERSERDLCSDPRPAFSSHVPFFDAPKVLSLRKHVWWLEKLWARCGL